MSDIDMQISTSGAPTEIKLRIHGSIALPGDPPDPRIAIVIVPVLTPTLRDFEEDAAVLSEARSRGRP